MAGDDIEHADEEEDADAPATNTINGKDMVIATIPTAMTRLSVMLKFALYSLNAW